MSLLRCTRALVGLLPDGPATLGELCSSLEDGLLLATTLDLLPGGVGEEVWLHLDVLFLLLYHNPCRYFQYTQPDVKLLPKCGCT